MRAHQNNVTCGGSGGSWPAKVRRLFFSPAPDPLLPLFPTAPAHLGRARGWPASQPTSLMGMVGVRPCYLLLPAAFAYLGAQRCGKTISVAGMVGVKPG